MSSFGIENNYLNMGDVIGKHFDHFIQKLLEANQNLSGKLSILASLLIIWKPF